MFTMLVSIFTWLAFVGAWITAAAAVGIYIFLNSKKYKMSTVLWTAVGLVFNVFGLCAYFIARDKKSKEYCPVCGAVTGEFDTFCPQCDAKLEAVRPRMKLVTKIFIGICVAVAIIIILETATGRV